MAEEMKKKAPLTKHAFDREYMTDWLREVRYLADKGIQHEYIRETNYGVSQYKYKKTPELFLALAEFYKGVIEEKNVLAPMEDVIKTLKDAGIILRRGENGTFKFVKACAEEEEPKEEPAKAEDSAKADETE